MTCPNISSLKFSQAGKSAIIEIQQKQDAANVLAGLLGSSALLAIFKYSVEGTTHKIVQRDWEAWTQAMVSVPHILKREIKRVARERVAYSVRNDEERKFWEALADGCE